MNSSNLNQINPNKFEFVLEMCRILKNQNNISQANQFFDYHFEQDQNLNNFKTNFAQHSQLYQNLGFEGYVSNLFTQSKISEDLKNQLLLYKSNLLTFLKTQPTLDQFTAFNNSKIASLSNNTLYTLCISELNFLKLLLHSNQGFAQYYYKHHPINITNRGCNFWEAIGCGLLAGVTGTAVGITAGFLVATSNIMVNGEVMDEENKTNFSIFVAMAVTTYITVNIYK
jgi:F0F1-type ATP synthase membrane subunit c/vacuolar-type H+-ATPase subunit K